MHLHCSSPEIYLLCLFLFSLFLLCFLFKAFDSSRNWLYGKERELNGRTTQQRLSRSKVGVVLKLIKLKLLAELSLNDYNERSYDPIVLFVRLIRRKPERVGFSHTAMITKTNILCKNSKKSYIFLIDLICYFKFLKKQSTFWFSPPTALWIAFV